MASKASSGMSKRQTATVERLRQVDSTVETQQVEDVILVSYTPRWEKGRMVNGQFRSNPNPTRLTHAVTPDGRVHGWGFGPVKVTLPETATITTGEDMQSVLKERVESRRPAKVEPEPEPTPGPEAELKVEKPKAAAKKPVAKKRNTTGVQVVAN